MPMYQSARNNFEENCQLLGEPPLIGEAAIAWNLANGLLNLTNAIESDNRQLKAALTKLIDEVNWLKTRVR